MYKLSTENLTRINNDVNGNPRYVFHFLALADHYSEAVTVAKKLIGGRKYHTKNYGGGIVFQSYNVKCEIEILNKYIEENTK